MQKVLDLISQFNPFSIKATGHVWKMWEHKSWGNNIEFLDWESRRISGHYSLDGLIFVKNAKRRLEIGDEVQCKMKSGDIGRFLIIELKYERDPADMFFGKVKDIGIIKN